MSLRRSDLPRLGPSFLEVWPPQTNFYEKNNKNNLGLSNLFGGFEHDCFFALAPVLLVEDVILRVIPKDPNHRDRDPCAAAKALATRGREYLRMTEGNYPQDDSQL